MTGRVSRNETERIVWCLPLLLRVQQAPDELQTWWKTEGRRRPDRWRVKVEKSRRRVTHLKEQILKERSANGTIYPGSFPEVPEISVLLFVIWLTANLFGNLHFYVHCSKNGTGWKYIRSQWGKKNHAGNSHANHHISWWKVLYVPVIPGGMLSGGVCPLIDFPKTYWSWVRGQTKWDSDESVAYMYIRTREQVMNLVYAHVPNEFPEFVKLVTDLNINGVVLLLPLLAELWHWVQRDHVQHIHCWGCCSELLLQVGWCLLWWQPLNQMVDTGDKGSHQAEEGVLLSLVTLFPGGESSALTCLL